MGADTSSKKEQQKSVDAMNGISADGLYDKENHLKSEYVDQIFALVERGNAVALNEVLSSLHPSELGDVLEALNSPTRLALVRLCGHAFDMNALTEVDEAVRLDIVDALPNSEIAHGLQDLESDDVVYILEDMEEEDQAEILQQLPFDEQLLLKRHLEYPEETVGRRMQSEVIAVPPFWTIGQAIDYMREDSNLPDRFHEIFVVSPAYQLLGSIQLDKLLRTPRSGSVEQVMVESSQPIEASMDQEAAALLFQQYDLLSAAVIDEGQRLVGVMTIDDIVDVINEEAEEDIKRLAGVGDEELSDSVLDTSKSRFLWLFVNLATAILASYVISLYDATLEQMVALAVLMPIVASMGGNAGTQTMTVAVRALAQNEIDTYNVWRIIRRELLVGIINGLAFALIVGIVVMFWFDNAQLGVIIGLAMIFNLFCAALVGILIPIGLEQLKIDPAIASSVFVTTVTDIVGFFAFLGIAAWWFGLG